MTLANRACVTRFVGLSSRSKTIGHLKVVRSLCNRPAPTTRRGPRLTFYPLSNIPRQYHSSVSSRRHYATVEDEPYFCGPLDSIFPPVVQTWVLAFPGTGKSKDEISKIFRRGLEKTLHQLPYLGRRLERVYSGPDAGRLKLVNSDQSKFEEQFSVNDLTKQPEVWTHSYQDLVKLGMPVALMRPSELEPPGGYPLLSVLPIATQVNHIDGGTLLYICIHHSIMDGFGGSAVLETWARNCRAAQKEMELAASTTTRMTPPIADPLPQRKLSLPEIFQDSMKPPKEEADVITKDGSLWHSLGLQQPPGRCRTMTPALPADKKMVTAIFAASQDSITHLRTLATPNGGKGTSTFASTVSFLWKSIMRARKPDLVQADTLTSHLLMPVSLRRRLGVPSDYPGNVVLYSITGMQLETLLSADGRQISSMVRDSLALAKDTDRARNAIKLSFVLPEPSRRKHIFEGSATQDLVLSSWEDLPWYKYDWGPAFGSPGNAEFVRVSHQGYVPGLCAIQPRRREDELEALINLEESQLEGLIRDTEFSSHFQLRCK